MSKNLLAVMILLFFSIVMGSIVHEVYHIFEYSIHDAEVYEVCFLGYKHLEDGDAGAWVHGQSKEVKYFKIPFAFDEKIPIILQLVTTSWCFLGLIYAFRRRE